ncbi:hypothetical protein B0P06_006094 [Clostridium saccharoperbutylacetonicum]|uniref:Virion structural protein n=2 Tax=Clostridium TaxID=1485 RepID=M1MYP8_9CLOT|nr:hypothetical protein [Clostridium saccharoperbutylacetonicum]AGF59631.1 virion structural protein [Clostridium saccharoperbutylacetonicum N1-4(HMT)]NRT64512.1 hypothetical protein [Clostridium saccharoperbutylacetonicum]NSB28987.1 hypothetical protein [Clostridium saccharoperbutylacetonicum]NSB46201.1 hypothetical protein [Clostridium saccharoperbutylacetonicum]
MNGYEYRQNNSALDSRLKQEVAKIQFKYQNGQIKTQTDYAYELKNAILEFYKQLGKPTMKFIPAASVPFYEEYTAMIENAINDMNTVIQGCSSNYETLNSSRQKTEDSIDILVNRIDQIAATTDFIKNKITAIRKASDIIISDDFSDGTGYKAQNSFIDTSSNALMLGIVNSQSISDNNIDIEILNTSNGFPGNTHEVYNTVGTINNKFTFKGENNTHIKLSAIKENNVNNNTASSYTSTNWFEFEMYNISDSIKEDTSMIGFSYTEGIRWVTDDDTLYLNLKLTLKSENNSNYVVIKGAPKTNETANPILHKVIVSDDLGLLQIIELNRELVGTLVIPFSSQKVKYVTLELIQTEFVSTQVCRQYGINIDPTRVSKYDSDDLQGYVEVEAPLQSIELLGLKYDKRNRRTIYPTTADTENFLDDAYVKAQLFYNTISSDGNLIKREPVNANRYSIGISAVDVRYRKYVKIGTYISKTFTASNPIKQLIFNSEDYIPNSFNNYVPATGNINDFIQYSISFDNGGEWHRIYPRHKASSGSCTIIVNSDSAVLNRNPNITYVDMLTSPSSFIIKIELSRPEDIIDETPIVYNYNLDISGKESF